MCKQTTDWWDLSLNSIPRWVWWRRPWATLIFMERIRRTSPSRAYWPLYAPLSSSWKKKSLPVFSFFQAQALKVGQATDPLMTGASSAVGAAGHDCVWLSSWHHSKRGAGGSTVKATMALTTPRPPQGACSWTGRPSVSGLILAHWVPWYSRRSRRG